MTNGRSAAVVVNFNAGDWLARSVASLLALPLRHVVVVDNGSTDGSLDTLPDDDRIQVIRNSDNRGYAAAVNQGVSATATPFVLLCNPDLIVQTTDAIDRLEPLLDEQPAIGVVGIAVRNLDGSIQRACLRRDPTPGRSIVTMLGFERFGLPGVNLPGPIPTEVTPAEAVSGAVLFVRRACWDALGGFDEGYFLHCEDLDLFRRARDLGWAVVLAPVITACHAGGVSHRRRRLASERHKHRGMLRYYRRFVAPGMPWPLRGLWPAIIRLRLVLLTPWWALRDRLAARSNGSDQ